MGETALQTAPYIDAILPDGVFPDRFFTSLEGEKHDLSAPKGKKGAQNPAHAPCDSPTFFVPAGYDVFFFLSRI